MPDAVEFVLEKNLPVPLRDGTILRADVFRPPGAERHPVLLTHGPYGKDVHYRDFNPHAWPLIDEHGAFMNWETVNPEWWVPRGYVVVRVDQRGTGASPGVMSLFSPGEFDDYFDAIEWAGDASWSNGRVGLIGVSYYAIGQWHVAAKRPPHLGAMVVWEGAVDFYRDWSHHGGILSNGFTDAWWALQVTGNQHEAAGTGENPERALDGNDDLPSQFRAHPLFDEFYRARHADLAAIDVPLLSAGSWSSYALHLRGNIEGFLEAGSTRKWLEVHSGNHYVPFYTAESRDYQKRFLDRWLRDDEAAWTDEPAVKLFIRTSAGGAFRDEAEWPLARTVWTALHLDAGSGSLRGETPRAHAAAHYDAPDGEVVFLSAPFVQDTEVTGPSALHVWVEADAEDLDLFVTIVNLDPSGKEVLFEDASGNPGPVVKGWLRVSHRALDPERTLAYRPWHTHEAPQPLAAGEPVLSSVEIMPTSMVFERGHRLGLVVGARDRDEPTRFLHNDPVDRAPGRFAGTNSIHTGETFDSYLLLPIIPRAES